MENRKRKCIAMAVAVVCVLGIGGCLLFSCGNKKDKKAEVVQTVVRSQDSNSAPGAKISVVSLSLNKTELTLQVNGSETLTATVLPDNATVKNVMWSSSDGSIAMVQNGRVTALRPGRANIMARSSDNPAVLATCTVTVP